MPTCLDSNRFVPDTADVRYRFDVMHKLKTPKFEQLFTVRTHNPSPPVRQDRQCRAVGIDARVFIPCKAWLCSDCKYAKASAEVGKSRNL